MPKMFGKVRIPGHVEPLVDLKGKFFFSDSTVGATVGRSVHPDLADLFKERVEPEIGGVRKAARQRLKNLVWNSLTREEKTALNRNPLKKSRFINEFVNELEQAQVQPFTAVEEFYHPNVLGNAMGSRWQNQMFMRGHPYKDLMDEGFSPRRVRRTEYGLGYDPERKQTVPEELGRREAYAPRIGLSSESYGVIDDMSNRTRLLPVQREEMLDVITHELGGHGVEFVIRDGMAGSEASRLFGAERQRQMRVVDEKIDDLVSGKSGKLKAAVRELGFSPGEYDRTIRYMMSPDEHLSWMAAYARGHSTPRENLMRRSFKWWPEGARSGFVEYLRNETGLPDCITDGELMAIYDSAPAFFDSGGAVESTRDTAHLARLFGFDGRRGAF